MQIEFKSLKLQNFKSHQDLTVNFGERTVITGDNAKGKSTIPEAITWLLYGTDTLGSKLDPSPITYEADETMVSLLMDIDGTELLLGRELKKGKAKYYINEVPSKATDFNEMLGQYFNKSMFLSLFNPNYFFTLKWTEQREMILQYVSAPSNKEVFKELPEAQAKKLAELLKKHSLDDLEKIHRTNKNKLDKQYIAAQSRTKTLKEQLENNAPKVPLESLQAELSVLTKQRDEIEKVTDVAGDTNSRINIINSKIESLTIQIERGREQHAKVKNTQIEQNCYACGQELTEEAKAEALKSVDANAKAIARNVNPMIKERKALREELATLEYIDVSEQLEKARKLQEQINPIEQEINKYKHFEAMKEQLEEAQQAEKQILVSLNESIFIIDSIKDFRAKEAELQAKKVQDLFETLSINLFEELKNGEIKATFEIEMDGKGYSKLSLSESIRAGLELREVLSKQSNINVPVFVDNAESITKFKEPTGQLIMARVVAEQELKIVGDK
ncbi:AAA family ATPase [Virgibacillus pantothenticus]|uniref:AAA family ATPase n=1 Tax=Virgibacillus pantothenticus TaxID=1473 RepID=UPI001C21AEF0|nr:AAA family ATPase [Virgibacillus pantothenticus]MBU8567607.1 AAA family ATPase [Virgibacillus pantothenticus]MBU8601395.1 AAA family ATPase [Virgibacillus pantothenticus]MBU8636212.1 AAA family ATPase [Virgibacillus pantothenticus]MBU8643732.1 AAA family ATPase [Virgibacillus pantothenticus]MBU8648012.1 AAA family ATPase [Virgibacillus pantothenticus]